MSIPTNNKKQTKSKDLINTNFWCLGVSKKAKHKTNGILEAKMHKMNPSKESLYISCTALASDTNWAIKMRPKLMMIFST